MTPGHADHIYGIGQLLTAFPDARAVVSEGTSAEAQVRSFDESSVNSWRRLFPGQIPQIVAPESLHSHEIDLEGPSLQILETGHTDTKATTALWVPDMGLLVSGDGALRLLEPTHAVAGHKEPARDDGPRNIDESMQYPTDFNETELKSATAIFGGLGVAGSPGLRTEVKITATYGGPGVDAIKAPSGLWRTLTVGVRTPGGH